MTQPRILETQVTLPPRVSLPYVLVLVWGAFVVFETPYAYFGVKGLSMLVNDSAFLSFCCCIEQEALRDELRNVRVSKKTFLKTADFGFSMAKKKMCPKSVKSSDFWSRRF